MRANAFITGIVSSPLPSDEVSPGGLINVRKIDYTFYLPC